MLFSRLNWFRASQTNIKPKKTIYNIQKTTSWIQVMGLCFFVVLFLIFLFGFVIGDCSRGVL